MAISEITLKPKMFDEEITLPAGLQQRKQEQHYDWSVSTGDMINEWKLQMRLCEGQQSVLFLAGSGDTDAIVKVYSKEKQQNATVMRRLSMLKDATLAPLLEYGKYQDHPFEVMPYYREGSLKGKVLPEDTVVNVVLPQLTTALHALHQSRILHNDIKPANIFWKTEGQEIVLADYDCASLDNYKEPVGGTLAFIAPEVIFSRGKAKSTASDYCAMGLTLISLLTGRSPLTDKTDKEIMRIWQRGIEYPENISPGLSTLLRGLTKYDPTKRMGYEEVLRWLKNQKITTINTEKKTERKSSEIHPLKFKNDYVLDIVGLRNAVKKDWEYGTFMLRQHQLDSFLIQFDKEYFKLCRFCSQMFDTDEALFYLLHSICPRTDFLWRGMHYQNLEDFAEKALAEGKLKSSSPAVHFCRAGLLSVYLEKIGSTEEQILFAKKIEKLSEEDPDLALTRLLISMNAHPEFSWHGEIFYSLEDVCKWLLMQVDLDHCVKELYESKKFEAWLDFMKYGKFIHQIKERLERLRYE